MKPNFPLKNIVINGLIRLRQPSFIQEYTEYIKTGDANYEHLHKQRMEILSEEFKQMDEEIHQVLYTSNAATKRTLFAELRQHISDFGLFTVNPTHIFQMAMQWNDETLQQFEKTIKRKEDDYFRMEERKKYKNLEQYTIPNPVPAILRLGGGRDYVTYTNYNFFCIKDIPDLIDYDFVGPYITFITSITERVKNILVPLIEQYDTETKEDSGNGEILFDRHLKKIKNNPVIAVFLVVGVITGSLFSFFTPFKEMLFPPDVLVFSAVKQKADSANSMLDIYLRNKSSEDLIIHKLELIITEKRIDSSTVTLPIRPILSGSATYDYLVNLRDTIYHRDVSHLIKGKSAERIFVVVALGSWDGTAQLIQSEVNTDGDVINDIAIKGIVRITFNENETLESDAFSLRITNKGNRDLISKSGITLDAYMKLLHSDDFVDAYHGIDLIRLIGGEQAIEILKEFRGRDLSYLKRKYESTYTPIQDGDMVLEVTLDQPTPEDRYREFKVYLDQQIKQIESVK